MQQASRPVRVGAQGERPETVPFDQRALRALASTSMTASQRQDETAPALLLRRRPSPPPLRLSEEPHARPAHSDDRSLAMLLVVGTLAAMVMIVFSAAPSLTPSALLGMMGLGERGRQVTTELDRMKQAVTAPATAVALPEREGPMVNTTDAPDLLPVTHATRTEAQ